MTKVVVKVLATINVILMSFFGVFSLFDFSQRVNSPAMYLLVKNSSGTDVKHFTIENVAGEFLLKKQVFRADEKCLIPIQVGSENLVVTANIDESEAASKYVTISKNYAELSLEVDKIQFFEP